MPAVTRPLPIPPERRRHRRLLGLWSGEVITRTAWVGEVATRAGSWKCVIFDLSAGGAKLRFLTPPALPGERVRVSTERFGGFDAVVRWQHDNKVGIRFLDPPQEIVRRIRPILPLPH